MDIEHVADIAMPSMQQTMECDVHCMWNVGCCVESVCLNINILTHRVLLVFKNISQVCSTLMSITTILI